MEDTEWCSWPKFAFYVYNCITDRNTDAGLRTLFDLFIDDPEKETISLPTFRKICQEVGDNMSDDELKNILEITTQSGNDISFDDFCHVQWLFSECSAGIDYQKIRFSGPGYIWLNNCDFRYCRGCYNACAAKKL